MMSTTILCVGNELRSDDGAAIRVGRVLESLPLPAGVAVRYSAQICLDWVDIMADSDQVILVDATSTGASPGTVRRFSCSELAVHMAPLPSGHAIGLPQLLMLLKALHPDTSHQIEFLGIEGEFLQEFGTALSASVQSAIPEAVQQVLNTAASREPLLLDPGLVAQAASAAQAMARWEPSLSESCAG